MPINLNILLRQTEKLRFMVHVHGTWLGLGLHWEAAPRAAEETFTGVSWSTQPRQVL